MLIYSTSFEDVAHTMQYIYYDIENTDELILDVCSKLLRGKCEINHFPPAEKAMVEILVEIDNTVINFVTSA